MNAKIKWVACIILALLIGIVGYYVWNRSTQSAELQSAPTDQVVAHPPLVVKNIPILVYHSIAPKPAHAESAMQKHYRVDPAVFDSQMKYLADHGYTPIRFDALAQYLLADAPIPEKPIVLTFDDGLLNQYDYAFPVLKKYEFVGTFFVYPGVTGHKGFMTWDNILDIDRAGNEIGSHTIIHYNLTTLDDPEKIRHELSGSKSMLEEKLGHVVETLAYPHYAENEAVRAMVQEAGYIAARAGWRSVSNSASEIFHLKAQEVINNPNPFASK